MGRYRNSEIDQQRRRQEAPKLARRFPSSFILCVHDGKDQVGRIMMVQRRGKINEEVLVAIQRQLSTKIITELLDVQV